MSAVASLHTIKRFREFIDDLPRLWKSANNCWELRFWHVTDRGRVEKIPHQVIEGAGRDLAIDSAIVSASYWCKRYQPEAVVLASEAWTYHMSPEQRLLLLAAGGTPNLSDEHERRQFEKRFRVVCEDCLQIYGEIAGAEPLYRVYMIKGRELEERIVGGGEIRSKFTGILTGEPAILKGTY